MRIVLCDVCGARIPEGIYKINGTTDDFCSRSCADERKAEMEPEGCQHEDNASDGAAGRSTARLICKACGYDRVEEVA